MFKSSNTDTLVPLHSVAAASIDFRRKTSHFHRYGKYQFSKLSILFIYFLITSNPNINEIKWVDSRLFLSTKTWDFLVSWTSYFTQQLIKARKIKTKTLLRTEKWETCKICKQILNFNCHLHLWNNLIIDRKTIAKHC